MRRVVDDLGTVLEVVAPLRRVVSLVPNLSELLVEWGLESAIVGVTEYCVEPRDGFANAARVRGTKNPDTATIAALEPDLVLANEEENRRLDVDRLRAAGVPVYVTRVRTVADTAACVARLGDAVGRPQDGAELREQILATAREAGRVADGSRVTGECAIWRNHDHEGDDEVWWLVGGASYAGDLLTVCGLAPVVRGSDDRYPRLPFGELVRAAPDVLLLPDEPYAFGEQDARMVAARGLHPWTADGTSLFWWGPRTPGALRWLTHSVSSFASGPRT